MCFFRNKNDSRLSTIEVDLIDYRKPWPANEDVRAPNEGVRATNECVRGPSEGVCRPKEGNRLHAAVRS